MPRRYLNENILCKGFVLFLALRMIHIYSSVSFLIKGKSCY